MEDDDIPKAASDAVEQANHQQRIDDFDCALQALAVMQQRLKVRTVVSTIQPNRSVIVSTASEGAGLPSPYAQIDREGKLVAKLGEVGAPAPKDVDT